MALAVLSIGLSGGGARADGSSIATLGVGTGLGIHKAQVGEGGDSETAFVNHLNVRVKALHYLGLDLAYDMANDRDRVVAAEGEPQYAATTRMSLLVYPYAADKVALYLGVGVGATRFAELFGFEGAGNSYQAGLGLEAYLDAHVAVDASFYLLAPGVRSVEDNIEARVDRAVAARDTNAEVPSWTDYVSLGNHEFMVRLFLFL